MKIEIFEMERAQSLYENTAEFNLTESGIHPLTLAELLDPEEIERLQHLRLGYGQTNGSPELREAVSAMYPGTKRENVLITHGSIEANFVTIWSMLDRGDELVLMLPNYMQIWGLARSLGIKIKPLYLKEELQWQPDLDELPKLITARTKMVAICNPNNPTGAVLSEPAMERIIELTGEAGAWLYADEIYRGAELSGRDTPTFYGRYEKVMIAGGLSKAYALPGLRIGWLVGPQEQIAQAWARRDYTTISTGFLSNYIAARALQPSRRARILSRNRQILNENLNALNRWVERQDGLFTFVPPQAGGVAFLRYHLPINSTELTEKLRRQKSTFIVAGDFFGMDHFIRIGIGAEPDYLQAGLARFAELSAEILNA